MKTLSALLIVFSSLVICKPAVSEDFTPGIDKSVALIDEIVETNDGDFTCEYMQDILPEMKEVLNELREERSTLKMTNRDRNIHAIGTNDLVKAHNLVAAMYNASCT